MSDDRPAATYAGAGVDLDAADQVVERIRPHVERTARDEVLEDVDGFAGLFALDRRAYKSPVLVTACDGVGTKLEFARMLGRHDTIGVDLVAMVVDDLVVCGAEPVVFCDYIATGRLDPSHVEQIVSGVADGCVQAGCALVGGETAVHPGVMAPDQYDVVGFGVGIAERERLLGRHRVEPGDDVVAMASNGLHANGYSLARQVLAGLDLDDDHGLIVQSLGEALLRPTRIYAPACLALARGSGVHAFCHVTGGGIVGNLPRVLPDGLGAVVDTTMFTPPDIFGLLARQGNIAPAEMWRTFNMGAGMLALVEDGQAAVGALHAQGVDAWVCGRVDETPGVRLAGLSSRPAI